MSKQSTGGLLFSTFKNLLIAVIKFVSLILSWALQLLSLVSSKLADAIEKIILKRL